MLVKAFFVFLVSMSFLNAKIISRTQVIMGTFITISMEKTNEKYLEHSFNLLKKIDNKISSYKKNSDISKLNKYKHTCLDPLTYEALILSMKYYKESDGYFDISIGSITKDLYAFGENERVPSTDELISSNVNMAGLIFERSQASIEKTMKIDLGGMGKGFGVDKISEYLKQHNIPSFVIAASGDIRCRNICPIHIQNPFNKDVLLSFKTIKKDTGISTSGNYNRYIKEIKYNHLINPKLKKSQSNFASITLVSNLKSSDLDAYATAASVMPLSKAYKFLDRYKLAYIIVQSDKKIVFSENIYQFIDKIY